MNTLHAAVGTPNATDTQRTHELMGIQRLQSENRRFAGTCGLSQGNRAFGFLPAFLDTRTGAVYLSRFADGRVAPVHLLDGLPPALVAKRSGSAQVMAATEGVVAGFVHHDQFYTRERAAWALNVLSFLQVTCI